MLASPSPLSFPIPARCQTIRKHTGPSHLLPCKVRSQAVQGGPAPGSTPQVKPPPPRQYVQYVPAERTTIWRELTQEFEKTNKMLEEVNQRLKKRMREWDQSGLFGRRHLFPDDEWYWSDDEDDGEGHDYKPECMSNNNIGGAHEEDNVPQAGMEVVEPAEAATLPPHQPAGDPVQDAGITQPTLGTAPASADQHVRAAGTQGLSHLLPCKVRSQAVQGDPAPGTTSEAKPPPSPQYVQYVPSDYWREQVQEAEETVRVLEEVHQRLRKRMELWDQSALFGRRHLYPDVEYYWDDSDDEEDDLPQAGMAAEPAEAATLSPLQPAGDPVQDAGITQPTLRTTQAGAEQHVGAASTPGPASQVETAPATQVTPAMMAALAAIASLTPEQLQTLKQLAAASRRGHHS